MMTPKERYLALVAGEKPDGFVNQYSYLELIYSDPLANLEKRIQGQDTICPWGVTIRWPAGEHAAIPHITDETKVLPDITKWRDYVHAPSLDVPEEAWDEFIADVNKVDRSKQLATVYCYTGLFERLHFLMGFEDALMNMMVEPEATAELLEYLTNWRIDFLDRITSKVQLDAVFFHDDWGSKTSTFFSPEVFRELIKPYYVKIYGFLRSKGLHVIHHADSYCATLVDDMVDVGIETWQGVLPSNNIPELQKHLKGKLILMGGFDSGIVDTPDVTEEEIRAHVREVIKANAPCGGWIPCVSNGGPECLYMDNYHIITDEIEKQSKIYFG